MRAPWKSLHELQQADGDLGAPGPGGPQPLLQGPVQGGGSSGRSRAGRAAAGPPSQRDSSLPWDVECPPQWPSSGAAWPLPCRDSSSRNSLRFSSAYTDSASASDTLLSLLKPAMRTWPNSASSLWKVSRLA